MIHVNCSVLGLVLSLGLRLDLLGHVVSVKFKLKIDKQGAMPHLIPIPVGNNQMLKAVKTCKQSYFVCFC